MVMRSVGFQLRTDGKAEVKNDFAEVKRAGQDAMGGVAHAAEEAGDRAARAADQYTQRQLEAFRKQAAAAKLAAAGVEARGSIDASLAQRGAAGQFATVNLDRSTGAARASAAAFEADARAKEEVAAAALKLRAAIDPLFTAQTRYDNEIRTANSLLARGAIAEAEHTAELTRAANAYRAVADAAGVAAERQRALWTEEAAAAKRAVVGDAARGGIDASLASRGSAGQFATVNLDRSTGSARQSAEVFIEAARAEEVLEQRTRALKAAIDPAWAAQDRFNAEMVEARQLVSLGAISLDDYVAKLRLEREALQATTGAQGRHIAGVGAQRAAMQNLSYQAQDAMVQLQAGTPILTVLTQQGTQATAAMTGLGGKAGAFAAFMQGPWGLAITGGVIAAGALYGWLKKTDDATDKLKTKTMSLVDALSKEKFATDAARKALADYNAAKKAAIEQDSLSAEKNLASARARLAEAMATREQTRAALEHALEEVEARKSAAIAQQRYGRGEGASVAYGQAAAEADAIRARLLAQTAAVNQTRETVRGLFKDVSDAAVRAVDPIEAINQRFKRMDDEAVRAASGSDRLSASLSRQRQEIERGRLAAVAAEEAKQQAMRKTGEVNRTETLTAAAVAKLLRADLPGVHVTSTTGGQHVKNSYHYRNQAVDFVPAGGMSSMSKADVRKIFESRGIEIVELLGPGDKGHNDHFHVAWTKGKLALDEFTDAAKRANDHAELVQGLKKEFDPAGAAADDLRAKLEAIGKANLDPATAERYGEAARAAFIKARAGMFELPGVEAFRPEAEAHDKAEADADKERADAEERRKQFMASLLADQQTALALSEQDLALVGANDNYREAAVSKLRLTLDLLREGVALDSERARRAFANQEQLDRNNATLKVTAAALDEVRGFGSSFVDTVLSEDTWSSWGNAGKTVLGMLKQEFITLALLNPLKNLINGNSNLPTLTSAISGIGNLLGGTSFDASGARSAANAALSGLNIGKNAVGTENWSGGLTWVNENGPELINLPAGTKITPAAQTRQLLAANDTGRGGASFHFDLRGAVVTEDLLAQMNAMADGAAMRGAVGGEQLAQRSALRAQSRTLA